MKAIRHVGIVVKDLDRALSFYRDLLGFKVVKKMEEKGAYISTVCGLKDAAVTTVKLAAADNNLIELLCFFTPASGKLATKDLSNAGFSHISCTVENIDAEFKRMSQAGVRFNSPPQTSPDGYAKVAFCQDPEGNFIELVEVL